MWSPPLCSPLLYSLRFSPKAFRYAAAQWYRRGSPSAATSTAAVVLPTTTRISRAAPSCSVSFSTFRLACFAARRHRFASPAISWMEARSASVGSIPNDAAAASRCCPPDRASAIRNEESLRRFSNTLCGHPDAPYASRFSSWTAYRCREPDRLESWVRIGCLERGEYSAERGTGCVAGMLCCPGQAP